ncbi:hypothetical protein [Sulfurovum sp.]|uniref:hypothetical protein n=1 Tax=Sulfurovum sp. TaxID=1969726 RepID=UPI002867E057|nr:hypothetical protein [Sulfurovum sp.]
MSIKDNVNFVKTELSGDEKVLESAFRLESLYRKHKVKLWGAVVVVVLYFGVQLAMTAIHETKLAEANEAFLTLQNKSDDANALKILKENNFELFELYSFAQAVQKQDMKALESLSASRNTVIADASNYTAAILNKKPTDSKLYNEMALFVDAYLAIGAGNVKMAKDKLELIDERSSLSVISGFLKHSTIKAQ